MELVMPDDNVKKEKTPKQGYLQETSQSFDKLKSLQVIKGDIVLRGQNGERDHFYPLGRACCRFWQMYLRMYLPWLRAGYTEQVYLMKHVLLNLGRLIQLAVAYRAVHDDALSELPKWCDAKYMSKLNDALTALKN